MSIAEKVQATAWRNRITGHGEEAPDQLLANPRNWRVHPKAQQDALAAVLDQVGWVQDVIVNQRTGHVVDGHARIALAISRQEPMIPVVYVDLDEDEERLILASLDPLSAMATTDHDAMRELLAEISVDDDALLAMFEKVSPGKRNSGNTDPDAVPEVPEQSTVQRGEVYVLGEHRLMCGDSTNPDDVALRWNSGAGYRTAGGCPPCSSRSAASPSPTTCQKTCGWRFRTDHTWSTVPKTSLGWKS